MTELNRPPDAFVSYDSADRVEVLAVVDQLSTYGLRCWIDQREMNGGDVLTDEVLAGLKACPTFIVFLSNSSEDSRWVSRELTIAYRLHKRVIPVRLTTRSNPAGRLELLVAIEKYVSAIDRSAAHVAAELTHAIRRGVESRRERGRASDGSLKRVPGPFWLNHMLSLFRRKAFAAIAKVGNKRSTDNDSSIVPGELENIYPLELEQIDLENVSNRCTIVSGEVGAGKSHLIRTAVDSQHHNFGTVITLSAGDAERIFAPQAQSIELLWNSVAEELLKRLRRQHLEFSRRLLAGYVRRRRILLVIEDLQFLSFDLSVIAEKVFAFIRKIRMREDRIVILASSRAALPHIGSSSFTRGARIVRMKPLGTDLRDPNSVQNILWRFCMASGHSDASLIQEGDVLGSVADLHRTPLFLALIARVSSPEYTDAVPLRQAVKLHAAELINQYLRVLLARAQVADTAVLVIAARPSGDGIMAADRPHDEEEIVHAKRLMLRLSLENSSTRNRRQIVNGIAGASGLDANQVDAGIDLLIRASMLSSYDPRGDEGSPDTAYLRFRHDAIEEYLLAWGFSAGELADSRRGLAGDYSTWRVRGAGREASIGGMLTTLLTSADTWNQLAFEHLRLAIGVLREAGTAHRPWVRTLSGPSIGPIVARWASTGAPYVLTTDDWGALESALAQANVVDWQAPFLKAIDAAGERSEAGARAILETESGQTSRYAFAWMKEEKGRTALAAAVANSSASRQGLERITRDQGRYARDCADIVKFWRVVKRAPLDEHFGELIEERMRTVLLYLGEADLKRLLSSCGPDELLWFGALVTEMDISFKVRLAAIPVNGHFLLLCPGKYDGVRNGEAAQSLVIRRAALIDREKRTVNEARNTSQAFNGLPYELKMRPQSALSWTEMLVFRELVGRLPSTPRVAVFAKPDRGVEVVEIDGQLTFARFGQALAGKALMVTSAESSEGSRKDFFGNRLLEIDLRDVIRGVG